MLHPANVSRRVWAIAFTLILIFSVACGEPAGNNHPPPTPPTANADVDKTITLPTISVSITGTASDVPPGTVISTAWSHVSGPATYAIVNPNSLTTDITGMTTAGTYVFRLTATDDQGATGFDDVRVVVLPVPPPGMGFLIGHYTSAGITSSAADAILNDAQTVLRTNDGPGDVACDVTFVRVGTPTPFSTGDGSIDSNLELQEIFSQVFTVNVVPMINFCAGTIDPTLIGCGQISGPNFIVERFTHNSEGILWAHEYGHNKGLLHNSLTDHVMYPTITTNQRKVDPNECVAYRSH